jgi:hypothetical protein
VLDGHERQLWVRAASSGAALGGFAIATAR